MRIRTTAMAIGVALLVAGTALAAPTAKDPMTMLLRKADMPAGTTYEASEGDDLGLGDGMDAGGVDTTAASYYGVSFTKPKGAVHLSGVVYVADSAAAATKGFTLAKKQRTAWWKKLGGAKTFQLPKYGDQQITYYDPAGPEGVGNFELLVRRNNVVWWLGIKHERHPPRPNADLLRDVKTYAVKQKLRVGNG